MSPPIRFSAIRKHPCDYVSHENSHALAFFIVAKPSLPSRRDNRTLDHAAAVRCENGFDETSFVKAKQQRNRCHSVMEGRVGRCAIGSRPDYTLTRQQRSRIPCGFRQKTHQLTAGGLRRPTKICHAE